MAVSFDEWRSARREGKQAVDTPDFATWRMERDKRKQLEEEKKRPTLSAQAGGRVGVPSTVGAENAVPEPAPLSQPMGGTLGLIQGAAGGVERSVDALGAIDPEATARGALGRSQQALGAAIRAPAELIQQGLGPLTELATLGQTRGPLEDVARAGAGIQESGTRTVEEVAPRMLERPEDLLSPEGVAWALQQATQSAGPMAIGALASRFGTRAGVAPFVPAGAADTYEQVIAQGGSPSDAIAAALPRGGMEVVFESPVMQAAGAGRLAQATLRDVLGEVGTEAGNIGLELGEGYDVSPEAARARMYGAAAVGAAQGPAQTMLSSPVARGVAAAREMLTRSGGVSDGRGSLTPKTKLPNKTPDNIGAPTSIAQSTEVSNKPSPIEESFTPTGTLAGDVVKREIPTKQDTPSAAPLSPVQVAPPGARLTPSDAGTIIDTRLSALREASQQNRLDDGTVKTLQREDEELRLTLQEDESRKQQGILQTPERPYLSDNARGLVSHKRAEIRERLEQHRAAVGYGNELRDLETRLSKLGESDTDVIALADSLVRGQGASVSRAAAQMAPASTQNQSQTRPATTPQAPATEAPVAPAVSVPASAATAPPVAPAPVEQNLVTSTQVPRVSNTPAKAPKKAPAPKVLSDKDAMTQATVELQSKALSDPTYQAFVQKNPAAFGKQIRERANQLKAESEAKAQTQIQAPPAVPPVATTASTPETPSLDAPATPGAVNISDKAEQARDNLLRQATTAKEALETVASDAFAASPAMRTIANKLLGSGDLNDVKAEVADTPEQVAKLSRKDGTTAGGRFTTVDNTMRVLPNEGGRVTQAAEVVIHEASHAATAAVVEGVRAGRIKDPELVGDVEDAELARQAVAKAIADGTLVDDTGRADNAARNVDELLATVFSSPTLRTKLDTVRVTIPRRGPRRGRIATALQVIKDLVFKVLKPLGITRQEVDQILVTEAVDKIVTRFAKEKSARDVMVGQQKGTSANMPNDIKQDFGVEMPTERGYVRGARNVLKGARELLTPRGEASFDAQRMGERAIGVANEMRLAADVVARDANKQLNELTKDLPPRQKALYRYNMAEYLAGNPDVDVPKDLKVSLDAMREILDNGTLRLIALGAVKPSDIQKMLNNLGKWTHRDYEVFHYKPGTATRDGEYKKKVQSEALEGKDVVADVLPDVMEDLKLPTPEVIARIGEIAGKKGGKKEWRSESGKLLREVQGKPDPKKERKTSNVKIRAAAETYLRDMAAMWGIGRTTKLEGEDGIIARLAALSEGGTDKLREAAKRYANSLLDPMARPGDDAPYSGKANPLSIDDSALDKERKQIPEWQRVLWGKFRDPITQFAASVEAQANVISKFTALEEYKQRGLKSGRVKENKAGMTDANMRPNGYVLLENADDALYYGPLQGMWVKVEDLEYLSLAGSMGFAEKLIRDSMGKSFGIPILTFFGQPAKMALIGADHTAQIVQYLSSVLMFSGSLLTPSTFAKASKGAKYTAFGGTFLGGAIKDETLDSDVKAWIKQGVLVNNALAGDARRKLSDLAAQPGEIFLPAPTRAKLGIQRTYGKAMDSLSRILSFGDETGKIMMAYARMEYLKDIHQEMSRDELRELAGEQTLMTTPSYNREAPVARMMGNSGFINVFAPFWAAMIRNTYNHLAIAAEYGKMPGAKAKKYAALELGQLGLKSAAASAYLAFLGAAAQGLVGMVGDAEEEERAKKAAELQQKQPDAVRALVSDYQLGNVELIREAGTDKYTYVAVQRFDPMPFGAIMSANERGDEQEIAEIIRSYLFSEAPVLRAVLETAAVTPTVLGNMALGDKSPLSAQEIKDTQKAIEGLKELTASFVPSGIKRVYKQATDDVDFNGLETVLANTGHTVGTLDLVKVAGQTAADYKGIIDARQSGMTADVNTDNLLGASADWTDNLVERAEAWTQARKKIEALQKLGKSDMWIRDAIKQNPYAESLSKQEVDSLLNGQFYVPDYRKWLNARHEAALKKAGTNQTKIKEVNDAFKQMHEDLQKQASGFTKALRTKGVIR